MPTDLPLAVAEQAVLDGEDALAAVLGAEDPLDLLDRTMTLDPLGQHPACRFALALDDEVEDRAADHLLGSVAEHLALGPVDVEDHTLGVDDVVAEGGLIVELAEPFLAGSKRCLGMLPLADVGDEGVVGAGLAVVVAVEVGDEGHGDRRAVALIVFLLVALGLAGLVEPSEGDGRCLSPPWRGDLVDGPADEFLSLVTEQALEGPVDVDDPAIEVGQEERLAGLVEQAGEAIVRPVVDRQGGLAFEARRGLGIGWRHGHHPRNVEAWSWEGRDWLDPSQPSASTTRLDRPGSGYDDSPAPSL